MLLSHDSMRITEKPNEIGYRIRASIAKEIAVKTNP